MRALLSVHDKTGLLELARGLSDLGWELVSSGGTAKALADAGIACTEVATVTGSPEMLDGRVKTLHPTILGGILADRDKPEHMAQLADRGIVPIDLVVCSLYPFRSNPSVELIDVGGPTMVRAAAKNCSSVTVLCDPADYAKVLEELRADGAVGAPTRRRLARAAFALTAGYDAAIAEWLAGDGAAAREERTEELPASIELTLERAHVLRYGENPHQRAARYRTRGGTGWWDRVVMHGGMALSYLNLFDADAAWQLVCDLGDEPAAAIIKHANPCGAAVSGEGIASAYERAFDCDPISAFGGIVALNRPVDGDLATGMVANPKADVLIAPGYSSEALELFAAKRKNMRILEAPPAEAGALSIRQIAGGFLVQDGYRFATAPERWQVVTTKGPTDAHWADLAMAWRVCGHVRSNAIVLVHEGRALGIGAGQQNRVDAARLATTKAAGRAAGGVCASDAFFPFRDGLDEVAAAGILAVVQPGGSIRDAELVAAAEEHGIAMVLTGERQFRH